MFWGLIMEPGKKYSQTVEKSFHVSQAALDLDSAQNEAVQVLLGFENRNYLLCTLLKGKWVQVPLDLNFQIGDKVSFATNGPGHVHLTGYLVPEDDLDLMEEDDVEEEEDEEIPDLVSTSSKKRKAIDANKREQSKANKKSKTEMLLDAINDEDSDDSDDSDVNLTDMLEGEEEAEAEEDDEEDGDDDDDDDDDDEEDDEEGDKESEEEIQKPQKSPKKEAAKQNGMVNKQEKTPKAQEKTPKAQEKTPKGQQSPQNKNKTPAAVTEKSPKKGEKTPKSEKGQKTPGKEGGGGGGTPQKKTIEGGVIIEDMKVGNGPAAKSGRIVQVYYEGRLKSNNKMFDSSKEGNGFKFRLGRQEVIKGWDIGVSGMKVGGKRRIVCPPSMAYGAKGSPPVIPANSTLVFEVELKQVK